MAHRAARTPTDELADLADASVRLLAAIRDGRDLPADEFAAGLSAARALTLWADALTDEAILYGRETSPHSGRRRATWAQLGDALGQDPSTAHKRHTRASSPGGAAPARPALVAGTDREQLTTTESKGA